MATQQFRKVLFKQLEITELKLLPGNVCTQLLYFPWGTFAPK